MNTKELEHKYNALPDKAKKEVQDFIDFLVNKYGVKKSTNTKSKKSNYGSAAGLIEMSDDFDEPLEDFKDYM